MDIALVLDGTGQNADLALVAEDLALDATLQTCVIISLLTDRLADADDVIPDGSANRRGWWADAYAPALPDGTAFYWGSKLWLRRRCTATPQNAALIKGDCQQALAWMIATNLAASVAVATQWVSATGLQVTITIARTAPANSAPVTYTLVWDATLGTLAAG